MCETRTHHGHTHDTHHVAHVGEVQVDHTGAGNHFGNTGHGVAQHVVSSTECLAHGYIFAQGGHQLVVRDNDERVYLVFQGFQAVFGNLDTFSFVLERAGHHSHGQDTQLTGNLGHYRSSAGTGAATHTGGNEQHIGALNGVGDGFTVFQSGITAGFRIGAGTQTFGQIST